jgi:hypothetical protein
MLPINWFLDPNLQAGPPDTDLLYDLVFRELSKSYWEDAKMKDRSIMELLHFIGQKAPEPKQERFPEFVFRRRHWDPDWPSDTGEGLKHSTQQVFGRTGGLIARVGQLFRSGKTQK